MRALSAKELQTINKPPPVEMELFSPTELDLVETDLLEFRCDFHAKLSVILRMNYSRSGEGLNAVEHNLISYTSQKEFDAAVNAKNDLFVLFWSHGMYTSSGVFMH